MVLHDIPRQRVGSHTGCQCFYQYSLTTLSHPSIRLTYISLIFTGSVEAVLGREAVAQS